MSEDAFRKLLKATDIKVKASMREIERSNQRFDQIYSDIIKGL